MGNFEKNHIRLETKYIMLNNSWVKMKSASSEIFDVFHRHIIV